MIEVEERQETASVETGDDRFCHLLDDRRRALCFADVTGRAVHDAQAAPQPFQVTGDWVIMELCATCGRQRCPTCVEIAAALARFGAA